MARSARTWAAALVAAAMSAMVFHGAMAQDSSTPNDGIILAPKPVVGVIDIQHIMAKAKAARQVAKQREEYLNAYQAEAAEQEKLLRDSDQKLAADRATLSQAEFDSRRRAFQARISDYQRQVQTRRRNLEKAFSAATNTIQDVIVRATDDVAGQHGMNIVLYRSQVFLFDHQMDITGQILTQVDKILPTVTMADPDSLGNQGGAEADQPLGITDQNKGAK